MKNIIFYFTGTGNSLQVANDIAKKIGECDVVNLAKYDTNIPIEAERIGVVFPVYFWGLPNVVKAFLERVKIKNNPYIFSIVTCGGLAGSSLKQVKQILQKQSKQLCAGYYIKMPDNYIINYNVPNPLKLEKIFNEAQFKVNKISEVILNKQEHQLENSKIILDSILGKLINNLVITGYATKDKEFHLTNDCIGCGKCEKVCSVSNIKIVNGKPHWMHHCEFCLGCIHSCPVNAINYKNSTQKRARFVNPNVTLN